MNKKRVSDFNLIQSIKKYFLITPFQPILQWAEANIDYSEDVSAQRTKLDFDLYPYQKEILKEWEIKPNVIKTIVVVAPQQTGKTNMFIVGDLYNMVYSPCQSMIVYPSDDLAEATNKTKLLPLMKHIPVLKEELDKPRSFRSDCYKFTNLVSYFQGAGSKIVSKSCKIVIGDEIDAWPSINGIDNIADLKKRTRSYNSSICFLISTPSLVNGRIWKHFLKGSQGYWYLRCKGCNQLTIRSCDINNLQFQSDLNEELKERTVRPETIRLICPKCGHEHVEEDKAWMNINGGYIHEIPERRQKFPSFQIGALASQLPSLSWEAIANAQLEAGKRADIEAQMTFDNSFRGLPYKRRQIVKEDLERLKDHEYKNITEELKPEDIEFVYGAVDSMDNYWRYGIFAADTNDNIHVLQIGEVKYLTLTEEERNHMNEVAKEEAFKANIKFEPIKTLEDVINKQYYGFTPIKVGQDAHAGHNYVYVKKFIYQHKPMIGYMGTKMYQIRYKLMQNEMKYYNVSAQHYKVEAIFYLYNQKKRDNQYMFFYKDMEQKYLDEIAAMKPDYNSKFGNQPQNWSVQNREDHAFDVVKMGLWVRDYCLEHLPKQQFNYCKSPRLKRRFEKQLNKQIKNTQRQINDNKNRWFNSGKGWLKV